MEATKIPDTFVASSTLFSLFDTLPSVYFYAKDQDHRYLHVNGLVLENVFGLADIKQLLGKTDFDFQPPVLAEAYHAEDLRVMESRQKIPNQVWLVPRVRGLPKWYISTKVPLIDPSNKVCGIAGVMYPIDTPEEQFQYFQDLAPIIRHIEEHFTQDLKMAQLADMAGLSTTQFNLRFRTLLRMSPSAYLLQLRIDAAQELLSQGKQSLSEISLELGFYDQSHFSKRFQKSTGMTPSAYRQRFRN